MPMLANFESSPQFQKEFSLIIQPFWLRLTGETTKNYKRTTNIQISSEFIQLHFSWFFACPCEKQKISKLFLALMHLVKPLIQKL